MPIQPFPLGSAHRHGPPILLLILAAILPVAACGEIYRWVDEDGQMHMSDTPPSDVTRFDREVIDRRGLVRERQEAPPSAAEREARAAEEARLRAEEEAAARQAEADRILLQSFGSERELIHTRDDRLALIDSELALLRERLEELRQERERLRSEGDMAQADALEERIRAHQGRLEEQRAQRERIEQRFRQDLERLRTLRARQEDAP